MSTGAEKSYAERRKARLDAVRARRPLTKAEEWKRDNYGERDWAGLVVEARAQDAADYASSRPVNDKEVADMVSTGSVNAGEVLLHAFDWGVDLETVAFHLRRSKA
jgi:hypothetical protein